MRGTGEAPEGKKCPWCGKETGRLVLVMWIARDYTETARVCAPCRKQWLKRLRREIHVGER